MKVRMKVQVLGTFEGVRWPAPGGEIDLPARVARHEIAADRAEAVAEPERERAEKRPARRAEKRG